MIYITPDSLNKIAVNLDVTISAPYFIFEFQHYATLTEYETPIYFTTPNLSTYCDRYYLFELTEDPNGSTTGGNDIPLYLIPGQYQYKIYQSTTDSLDPETFGDLLQTGKMVVGDMTIQSNNTEIDSIYR